MSYVSISMQCTIAQRIITTMSTIRFSLSEIIISNNLKLNIYRLLKKLHCIIHRYTFEAECVGIKYSSHLVYTYTHISIYTYMYV